MICKKCLKVIKLLRDNNLHTNSVVALKKQEQVELGDAPRIVFEHIQVYLFQFAEL
jgi:hypothetical protein